MKRRTFLKGMVAAPVAVQAIGWDQIFVKDDGKEIASNKLPPEYTIRRHAMSLGPPPVTIKQIEVAKEAIINWVMDYKLGKYHKNFRFMYMLDDHDNDVGIGIAIYNTPRKDVGMTWGQMIREMKSEDLII